MRIEVEGQSDEHIIGNNTRNNYRRTFDNNRKAIVMEDLIKREDAIKVIEETPFIRRPILPHYLIAKIKDIPSAELIEVHKYCWVKEFGGDGADCSHDFEPNGICQACGFMKISYAEPKQGEWISLHNGKWKCSECGIEVLIYAKGNFCPNCGADMRERESE